MTNQGRDVIDLDEAVVVHVATQESSWSSRQDEFAAVDEEQAVVIIGLGKITA